MQSSSAWSALLPDINITPAGAFKGHGFQGWNSTLNQALPHTCTQIVAWRMNDGPVLRTADAYDAPLQRQAGSANTGSQRQCSQHKAVPSAGPLYGGCLRVIACLATVTPQPTMRRLLTCMCMHA